MTVEVDWSGWQPVYAVNTPDAWNRRVRKAKTDWGAAMWSEHGQTVRFTTVVKHLDLRPSDNLLDFGCGTGRFVEFLPKNISYVGVDSASEMLDRAREENRRGSFYDKTPPWKFDHTVAIGIFNLSDGWTKKKTWATLDHLWESTRRTMIVSLYRGVSAGSLIYTPPEVAEFAMLRTTHFIVDCTYLNNDVMLIMRKEGAV